MAVFRSTVMFVFILTITLHISLLCGVISMGTDSTAVTLHESEIAEDDGEDIDGAVAVEEEDLEIFEATSEWQTIKEGQAIPRGLHVRINLSTGEKEAKLLDEDGQNPAQQEGDHIEHDTHHDGDAEETSEHSREELRNRLAKVTGDDHCEENCEDSKEQGQATDNEALIEEVKKRYRSIDELKKEFAEMELKVETDFEVMKRLVTEYKEKPSTENRKLVLQDLEFYVHQVDNAVDFKQLGGYDLIIAALNSTEEEIRAEAAHVIGSAVQSNPKAQVIAFDGGALQALLRLLAKSPSSLTQRRALFALSSLLRFFPYGQQKFLDLGGLSVLTGIMREEGGADRVPIRVKSVTFLHDLLTEQNDVLSSSDELTDVGRERKLQYEKITLATMLVDQGWCELVPGMLDVPDHDTREKILLSLRTLSQHCGYERTSELSEKLESLGHEYRLLAEEEQANGDGDSYFSDLQNLVLQVVQGLS